jgi:hypothetical protein
MKQHPSEQGIRPVRERVRSGGVAQAVRYLVRQILAAHFFALAGAFFVIVGLIWIFFRGSDRGDQSSLGTSLPERNFELVARGNTPPASPTQEKLRGPAANAVGNLLASKPALRLSDEQIEVLSAIFARHYLRFVSERNSLVSVSEVEPGVFEIQIPRCAELGEQILRDFQYDLATDSTLAGSAVPAHAQNLFESYTESAGRNGVTYTLTTLPDQPGAFRFRREVAIFAPGSKQLTGTGLTWGITKLHTIDPVVGEALARAGLWPRR